MATVGEHGLHEDLKAPTDAEDFLGGAAPKGEGVVVAADGQPQPLTKQRSLRRPGPPNAAADAAYAVESAATGAAESNSTAPAPETQLADVWRHLKQLEQAVKSHMHLADGPADKHTSGGIGRGGNSILSAGRRAAGPSGDASAGSSSDEGTSHGSPAASARLSERARLKDSLSQIKSEIAEKAIREVEAQLLQQRVACLEAALAGLTGGGLLAATGPGCPSCAGSYAGSLLSLSPGRPSICLRCQSQPQQQQQQASRASITPLEPRVSQLYDRLGDMETAMRELAHAQATSSSVLSELGGRLGPAAATTSAWPPHASTASPVRSSLLRRPPSCPPSEGPLSCWNFCSPPAQRPSCNLGISPVSNRPSSACALHAPSAAAGFNSVLANPVFSPQSPARPSAAAPVLTTGPEDQLHGELQPPQQQQASTHKAAQQQGQDQHHWHVDVVLASHDAELAAVKDAVTKLEHAQEATAALADNSAMHVASHDHRIQALEDAWAAVAVDSMAASDLSAVAVDSLPCRDRGLEATLSRGVAPAAAAGADVRSLAHSNGDGSGVESFAAGQLLQGADGRRDSVDLLLNSTSCHQTQETNRLSDAHSADSPGPLHPVMQGPSINNTGAAMLQQLLDSKLLDELITLRLEQLLQTRVEQAVSAQLGQQAAASTPAAGPAVSPTTDTAAAAASSPAQLSSSLNVMLQEGAQQLVPLAAPLATPQSPKEQPGLAAALQEDSMQDQEAEPVQDGFIQQLHGRLLTLEGTVQWLVTQKQEAQVQHAGGSNPQAAEATPASAGSTAEEQAVEGGKSPASTAAELMASPQATADAQATQPEAAAAAAAAADAVCSTATQAGPASSAATDAADGCQTGAAMEASQEAAAAAPGPVNVYSSPAATLTDIEAQLALPVTATAAAAASVVSSRYASTTQLEQQVAALQTEVDCYQLQAMQSALDKLGRELQQLQTQQCEQAQLIDSQKVATGASLALLMPLEPRTLQLTGQLDSLADQVAALHALAAQQPARFEVLQSEIEQLSHHLAQVNAAAAEESDVDQLRQQLEALQQQHGELRANLAKDIQAATDAAAAAAAMASTATEVAAGVELSTQQQLTAQQQLHEQAAEAVLVRLAAVETSLQGLGSVHEALSGLQDKVELQVQEGKQQAAAAAATAAQQRTIMDEMASHTDELAAKLMALEVSVDERVSKAEAAIADSTVVMEGRLQQHDQELQAAFTEAQESHDADLKQQLKQQVDTMAQILTDVGTYRAEQAAVSSALQQDVQGLRVAQEGTRAEHGTQLETLAGQLQMTAQQLKEELSSTVSPLQTQLQAATATLADHASALESTRSVAAAVQMLQALPAAAADLTSRLDELAQAQRAAEGELAAHREHNLVLDQQLATASVQLQALEAAIGQQQERGSQQLQQLRQELLEPVVEELERLQQHKQRLQQLQQEQAAAVERLGGALEAVKEEVLTELARERQQLAQAIEELQFVVDEQCVKTDQLGSIFSARDNMYGAWFKMQALFDANKTRRSTTTIGAGLTTHDRSPSSSLFRGRNSLALEGVGGAAAGTGSIGGLLSTSGSFDPFSELLNRAASAQQQEQGRLPAGPHAGHPAAPADSVDGAAGSTAATAGAAAGAAAAASSQLVEVAEAQSQLREEVGSLAVQLHAAMADLSEQVAALRQHHHHQQQPSSQTPPPPAALAPTGTSSTVDAAGAVDDAAAAGGMQRASSSTGSGVLHAPLSLVLQQELSAMRTESISKDQFAAVVRMVKELRSQSCVSEASSPTAHASSSPAATCFASGAAALQALSPQSSGSMPAVAAEHVSDAEAVVAAGAAGTEEVPPASNSSSSSDNVADVLQQHSQQLAPVQTSLEALMQRLASAESGTAAQEPVVSQLQLQLSQVQQQVQEEQQRATHSAQDVGSVVAELQSTMQQQSTALASSQASASATQQQLQQVATQQASLQAELSKVSAYVDELASKLYSAANAAALAAARTHSAGALGESSGGGGFAETVAGLSNLKACLDQQAKAVAELSSRLEDQEAVLQGLLVAAAQPEVAAASASQQADGINQAADCPDGSSSGNGGGYVSRHELMELVAQVSAMQQKLAGLEEHQSLKLNQRTGSAARQADSLPGSPSAAPAADESAGEAADAEDGGEDQAVIVTGAAVSTTEREDATDSQPLGFMHGMLVELKKRISKLESDSIEAKATAATVAALSSAVAAAAAAAPAAPAVAAQGPPAFKPVGAVSKTARRGAAWAGHGHNAALQLPELQEWLVCLHGEVARLNAQDSSLAATVESLRGDVGAAAAAAAAAVSAAAAVPTAAPTAVSIAAAPVADQTEGAAMLWAAVDELKAQLLELQQAESTAQAAAWASPAAGHSLEQQAAGEELKQQLLAEVAAMQAAWEVSADAQLSAVSAVSGTVAETVQSLGALKAQVSELADMQAQAASADRAALASAVTAAAAAAATPAAGSLCDVCVSGGKVEELQGDVQGLKDKLWDLQQQMEHLAAQQAAAAAQAHLAASTAAPAASPAAAATATAQRLQGAPSADGSALPAVDPSSLQKRFSFGDLASSVNGGSAAVPGTAVPGTDPAREEAGYEAAAGAFHGIQDVDPGMQMDLASGWQLPEALPAGAAAASEHSPSRQPSDASSSSTSRSLSRHSSTSSRGSSRCGKLSVRQLLQEMSSLPAAKQVSIVVKLAGLVSSHATRLLATYHDDPELSAQLQAVQQLLTGAVQGASPTRSACTPAAAGPAAGAAATDGAKAPTRGSLGETPSMRSRWHTSGEAERRHTGGSFTAAAAAATAGSNSSSSSSCEALLCILDQVASLRAIGSATHPAIAEALQTHEAQLSELKQAQETILAAIRALTGGTGTAEAAAAGLAAPAAPSSSSPSAAADAADVVTTATAAAASLSASASLSAAPSEAETLEQQQQQQPAQLYEGELAQRLYDVESRLSAGLKVLSAVRAKLPRQQEVADATQTMVRELQVAHGVALQRLGALEGLAAAGAAATTAGGAVAEAAGSTTGDAAGSAVQAGGVLGVAGSLRKLQEDIQAAARRLSALETRVSSQLPECVTLSRRLAARQADADTRSNTVISKVSSLASALPPLAERVAQLDGRLTRSLSVAKQGLDILADQLVALGALNGRSSPNKNPLAALGPHHAAMTALEGKVEAVRTALTASVKLMMHELAALIEAATEAGSECSSTGTEVGAGVTVIKALADDVAKAAAASQEDAMKQLESKLAEIQTELRATTGALHKD